MQRPRARSLLTAAFAAGLTAGAVALSPAPEGAVSGEDVGRSADRGARRATSDTTANVAAISAEAERARDAGAVLEKAVEGKDQAIPRALLDDARAIAVIPNVIKGAVIAGGQYGKGLVAARDAAGEWGAPVYVTVGGASFGFQAGIESVDLVLVFTSQEGLMALLDDELELGATIEVAAGPLGRSASAGTNLSFDAPIYSYSRSKGLFAGVSLVGVVLRPDSEANEAVYGSAAQTIENILSGMIEPPRAVDAFLAALPGRTVSAGS